MTFSPSGARYTLVQMRNIKEGVITPPWVHADTLPLHHHLALFAAIISL